MPWLVGDSFGQLQAADQASQNETQRGLAYGMANLLGTLRQRNHDALIREQMRRQDEADAITQMHADRDYALRMQQASWMQQHQAEADKLAKENLALSKRYVDWTTGGESQTAMHDREFSEKLANQYASTGGIANKEHALALFRWMRDPEAEYVANASQRVRDEVNQQADIAEQTATLLNKHKLLTDEQTKADNELKKLYTWNFVDRNPVKERKERIDAQLLELSPLVNAVKQDKERMRLVSPSAKGEFIPTIKRPNWPTFTPPPRPKNDFGDELGYNEPTPMSPSGTRSVVPAAAPTGALRHTPLFYDRVNYWLSQTGDFGRALQRAAAEEAAIR